MFLNNVIDKSTADKSGRVDVFLKPPPLIHFDMDIVVKSRWSNDGSADPPHAQ